MTTIVNCSGIDDTAAVQAAINAGGIVRTVGPSCKLKDVIKMNTAKTTWEMECQSVSDHTISSGLAISIAASECGIIGLGPSSKLWGNGVGVQLGTSASAALRPWVKGLQINTLGTGVIASNGAGLWASDLHFNGTPGNNTMAFRFGNWDTAFITDVLSEQHDHGMRLGWSNGSPFNLKVGSITFDRLNRTYGNALTCSPSTGFPMSTLQINSIWASSGQRPIVLDASSAAVKNIQIMAGYYTDMAINLHSVHPSVTGFQHPYELWG